GRGGRARRLARALRGRSPQGKVSEMRPTAWPSRLRCPPLRDSQNRLAGSACAMVEPRKRKLEGGGTKGAKSGGRQLSHSGDPAGRARCLRYDRRWNSELEPKRDRVLERAHGHQPV